MAIIAKNAGKLLPLHLALLERQDYPKDRIVVHIATENGRPGDRTVQLLRDWTDRQRALMRKKAPAQAPPHDCYSAVSLSTETRNAFLHVDAAELGDADDACVGKPHCWNLPRYKRMISIRHNALQEARQADADVFLAVDVDVALTAKDAIRRVVGALGSTAGAGAGAAVAAPLLHVLGQTWSSNFWAAVQESGVHEGYYKSDERYEPICLHEEHGAHEVPVVHSAIAIDLRQPSTRALGWSAKAGDEAFDSNHGLTHLPFDDVVAFGTIARHVGAKQVVLNDRVYGFMLDTLAETQTYAERDAAWATLHERVIVPTVQLRHAGPDSVDTALAQQATVWTAGRRQAWDVEVEGAGERYMLGELLAARTKSAAKRAGRGSATEETGSWNEDWPASRHDAEFERLCGMTNTTDRALHDVQHNHSSEVGVSNAGNAVGTGIELLHSSPAVQLLRNLVTSAEAKTIIDAARSQGLKDSIVFNPESGAQESAQYRKARTTWLSRREWPIVDALYRRVQRLTGLNLTHAEDLQVGRYEPDGGFYDTHFDFTQPDIKAWRAEEGNRLATVLIYLNEGFKGGATAFTRIGVRVPAIRGSAAFWYNLLPGGTGDVRTKHGGCPAFASDGEQDGEQEPKWVANLWIHDGGNQHVHAKWGRAVDFEVANKDL